MIHTNRWLNTLYERLGFSNETSFLRFLGIVVVGLLIFSNALKAGKHLADA